MPGFPVGSRCALRAREVERWNGVAFQGPDWRIRSSVLVGIKGARLLDHLDDGICQDGLKPHLLLRCVGKSVRQDGWPERQQLQHAQGHVRRDNLTPMLTEVLRKQPTN
eukprot:9494708-Pyramimonas_sp.AAC.1